MKARPGQLVMSRDVTCIKFRDEAGKCVGATTRGEDGSPRLYGRYTRYYEICFKDGRTDTVHQELRALAKI